MVRESSFVQAYAADADWRVAVGDCRRQLQRQIATRAARHRDAEPFTLGWCYLSDYYAAEAEAILEELRLSFPGVAWVGTAGIGVAAGGLEFIDEPALALMLAPLRLGSFRLFSGRRPLPTASSGFAAHTALVHAEASTPDVQDLLHELSEHTATGYLFGGLSSARNRTLHIADGVFSGGLSGVLFGPEVGLISRVTQGCQPIGPMREITRGEDNLIATLDDQPALDCAIKDLGLPADLPNDDLAEALSAVLVGLSSGAEDTVRPQGRFGSDTLVRHLVAVDPAHRILAIGDQVAPGSRLAFCRRDPQAAQSDLVRIASEIRGELDSGRVGEPAGALYVSCSGRGGPHFGARNAELETLRGALGDLPLVGFFAGGEIARDHLYGYTGVLTVFTSAAGRSAAS